MSSVCNTDTASTEQNISHFQNLRTAYRFYMSGSSFIQSVGVMDKKDLFDEALQGLIIKLPVMS